MSIGLILISLNAAAAALNFGQAWQHWPSVRAQVGLGCACVNSAVAAVLVAQWVSIELKVVVLLP